MLARVAEALYLTGRELERAENVARLLETTQLTGLEAPLADAPESDAQVWQALLETTADHEHFRISHGEPDESSVGWFLTFSPENPDSIAACVARAREHALSVRDRLPVAVWEGLNETYLEIQGWSPGRLNREGIYPFSRALRRGAAMMHGQIATGMRRDDAWFFLRLGRFLERASGAARWLRVSVAGIYGEGDQAVEAALAAQQCAGLLDAAGAAEAYATRFPGVPAPETVLRFLTFDQRFPRSLAFALGEVEDCLINLTDDLALARKGRSLDLVQSALIEIGRADGRPPSSPLRLLCILEDLTRDISRALQADCFAAIHLAPNAPDAQIQSQSQN